jgi:hypothetical protein
MRPANAELKTPVTGTTGPVDFKTSKSGTGLGPDGRAAGDAPGRLKERNYKDTKSNATMQNNDEVRIAHHYHSVKNQQTIFQARFARDVRVLPATGRSGAGTGRSLGGRSIYEAGVRGAELMRW